MCSDAIGGNDPGMTSAGEPGLPEAPAPPGPLPPNWWRCRRRQAVSGRYEGGMVAPGTLPVIRRVLDLRVDIDPAHANSPVMNRVSGDTYRLLPRPWPLPPSRVYQESWIMEAPTVTWGLCRVEITGAVRWWSAPLQGTGTITITWDLGSIGPATVVLTDAGGASSTFTCNRQSAFFRSLSLEIDVCASVNQPPLVPSYDTDAHALRPAGLPRRTLSIEESYREAGVDVTIDPTHTVIDDSAAGFASWSPAELHDAMEANFSRFGGPWPSWQMWGVMAGRFDNPGVGGIMYDAAAQFGGAGEAPERQGFAVFRNHQWFTNLPAGAPATQDEAWALRHFLYTWVHEAGHAFNLLHSWNKARDDSLSWMNYDWKYDQRNGQDAFWKSFRFRFDDEELLHIRHGNRAAVIMGGDPWSSGGHLEAPPGAMAQLEGDAPLEFLLRSKGYFEFLEPVSIELRLRNMLSAPQEIDARLSPEYGGATVYIKRPSGQIVEYAPVFCKLGTAEPRVLAPKDSTTEGEDRYSDSIFLSFGGFGFYFDDPGEYLVRAVYQGAGEMVVPSNTLRLRIGHPVDRERDVLAQDFFTPEVGMSLYLEGSQSERLKEGMAVLADLAERASDTPAGAKAAEAVGRSLARPFFAIDSTGKRPRLKKTHEADPAAALAVTAPALEVYRKTPDPKLNLNYHALVRGRAETLAASGQKREAKKEVQTLQKDLKSRGVNESVLKEIKAFEGAL